MKIERPTYMQQLIESKDNGLIKIVTGLRRVGKSYLLKTLFKEYLLKEGVSKDHILIIDLEGRKQKAFKDPDYLGKVTGRQAPLGNEEIVYRVYN